MRTFSRLYVVAMAIVAAVALLMSLPGVAILVLLLTLGLAFPLVFAATLLPYMACLLPAILSFSRRRVLLVTAPFSALLVAAWYSGPNWHSMREASAVAAALTANDISPSAPIAARTFELRRPKAFQYRSNGHFLDQEQCSEFCRSLLLGGEVDWVRIVMTGAGNGGKRSESARFVVVKGAVCAGRTRWHASSNA